VGVRDAVAGLCCGLSRMRRELRIRVWLVCYSVCLMASLCYSQDLTPRAYVITPVHWNAITLTYSFETGSILFDNALPIAGASGTTNTPIISYYHALNFLGRSANINAALAYSVGHFQGDVNGTEQKLYRSGPMDSIYSILCEPQGRAGDAHRAVHEMAAKDNYWHQRKGGGSHRSI
jgi:hypothetical protein